MLQKYHPNPLSHFLALHNSQTAHNHVVDAHALATTIANSQYHHSQQQQQQQHQQMQPANHQQHLQLQQHHQQNAAATLLGGNHHHQNSHQNSHHIQLNATNNLSSSQTSPTTALPAASPNHISANQVFQHTTNNLRHHHHPHHHHHHQQHSSNNTQQFLEAATGSTTLDAGKSFTIAAILGLQKSAMENSCKEYTNNVINLSLNGGCSNNNNNNEGTDYATTNSANMHHSSHLSTTEQRNKEQTHQSIGTSHSTQNNNCNNNNNNNNNRDLTNMNLSKSSNICHSFNNTNNSSASIANSHNVNSFNCDNATAAAAATALMNRYLPSAMANVAGAPTATPVLAHQHQHSRANSFVAAAAAAAAAVVNVPVGPSALQSLQQLHQQHAVHQTNLNFQREKLKSESNAKKSSLKNKRVRTIFTPEQLERLEAEFERQQYMVGPERLYLAHTLQLTEAQVKVWFQNRRIKWRKHHLEMTQQRLAILRQTQIAPASGCNEDQSPVKIDVNDDDDDDCQNIKREDLRDLNDSHQDTESELSVCNDSVDAESIIDDDDET